MKKTKRKITAIYFDVENGKRPEVKEVDVSTNDEIYKLLNCSAIEIPSLSIGGKTYCVVCDDVGLLERKPLSIFTHNSYSRVYGNVLITNQYGDELDSLSTVDIVRIISRVGRYVTNETRPVLFADN